MRCGCALWMEADRMGWLLPALTDGAVRDAARRRAQRAPAELREPAVRPRAVRAASRRCFRPIIRITGRRSAIPTISRAATLDDARAFFARYYHPGNASLVHRRRRRRRRRRSSWRRAVRRDSGGAAGRAGRRRRARRRAPRRLVLEDRVELPRLYLAWPSPALFAPGDAELDLVARSRWPTAGRRGSTGGSIHERADRDGAGGRRRRRASSAARSRSSRRRRPGTRSTELERGDRSRRSSRPRRPRGRRRRARARPRAGRGGVRLSPADARRLRRQGRSAERLQRLSRASPTASTTDLRRYLDADPGGASRGRAARGSIRRQAVALCVVPRGRVATWRSPGSDAGATGDVTADRFDPAATSARRRRCDFRRSRATCSTTACASGRWRTRPCRSCRRAARRFAAARRPIRRTGPVWPGSRPTCSTRAPARATRFSWPTRSRGSAAQLDIDVGPDVDDVRLHDARAILSAGAGAAGATSCMRPHLAESDFARVRELRLSRLRQLSRSPSAAADRAFSARSSATIRTGTACSARSPSLAAITLDDVREFWRGAIRPADATLVVAGDVDQTAVVSAARAALRRVDGARRPARRHRLPRP